MVKENCISNSSIGTTPLDKLIEMAGKEISAMRNIDEITFKDFFQSRIIKTKANTTLGYGVKIALKLAGTPLYFCAFKLYQFGKSIDYH